MTIINTYYFLVFPPSLMFFLIHHSYERLFHMSVSKSKFKPDVSILSVSLTLYWISQTNTLKDSKM